MPCGYVTPGTGNWYQYQEYQVLVPHPNYGWHRCHNETVKSASVHHTGLWYPAGLLYGHGQSISKKSTPGMLSFMHEYRNDKTTTRSLRVVSSLSVFFRDTSGSTWRIWMVTRHRRNEFSGWLKIITVLRASQSCVSYFLKLLIERQRQSQSWHESWLCFIWTAASIYNLARHNPQLRSQQRIKSERWKQWRPNKQATASGPGGKDPNSSWIWSTRALISLLTCCPVTRDGKAF